MYDDEENKTRPAQLIYIKHIHGQNKLSIAHRSCHALIMPVNVPDHCISVTGSPSCERQRLCYDIMSKGD